MKILKIKYCNENFKECPYMGINLQEKQYECNHPDIIKELKKVKHGKSEKVKYSKVISKFTSLITPSHWDIEIPKWCPLDECEKKVIVPLKGTRNENIKDQTLRRM